jgi:hypothetical protein
MEPFKYLAGKAFIDRVEKKSAKGNKKYLCNVMVSGKFQADDNL